MTQCGLSAGFIANRGQVDGAVHYYVSGPLASVYFTKEAVVLDLKERRESPKSDSFLTGQKEAPRTKPEQPDLAPRGGCAVWMRFMDGHPAPTIEARGELRARYNYFVGKDSAKWCRNVPAYAEIVYHDLWPGIDLVYRIEGGKISYEVITAPGADPNQVCFEYEGTDEISHQPDGSSLLKTVAGTIIDLPPVPGVRSGEYVLFDGGEDSSPNTGGQASAGNSGDKVNSSLLWSTYLNGGNWDFGRSVALDAADSPFLTGRTDSPTFPATPGAYQTSLNGIWYDAFVAKLDATGSNLLWCTFLGGTWDDGGESIIVDPGGNPVVLGITWSADFPITSGVLGTALKGNCDLFAAKLSSTGSSLVWSTYFGGSADEGIWSGGKLLWTSNSGIVLAGNTMSTDLVTTSGAYSRTLNGPQDLFVAKISYIASHIIWCTYLGGSDWDEAGGIALDSAENLLLTGKTASNDYPTTAGAYDQTFNGSPPSYWDTYVTKLDFGGGFLHWSTYLGGTNWDSGEAIVVDALDYPFVAGTTASADFPTTPMAYDPSSAHGGAFVTKLQHDGRGLAFSTFLSGSVSEGAHAIVLDPAGNPIVTGDTSSSDFPTTIGAQYPTYSGNGDAFVSTLSADGRVLLSSTYLGGSLGDIGQGITCDTSGDAVVIGETSSNDFPTTAGAYDPNYDFVQDIFVSKFDILQPIAPWVDVTASPLGDTGNGEGTAWADYDNDGDLDLYLANWGQANRLFRNDGGYVFVDVAPGTPLADTGNGVGVAWGDYDNDGDLDLYLANDGQANKLFRNDGGGVFADATVAPLGDTGNSTGVAWGDYDNDGDFDLYFANYGQANKLLRNNGGGSFSDVTTSSLGNSDNGMGVAWGDYDNDGDLDLYLANDGQANKLLRNDGGGVFTDVSGNPLDDTGNGTGVAWGDLDNDGYLDIYLVRKGQPNKVFWNLAGGGGFVDVTPPPLDDAGNGMAVTLGDYDRDGDLDVYLVNDGQPNKLFENVAAWLFADVTISPLGDTGSGHGAAWGDCNGDLDLDLYLANYGQGNRLLRNDLVPGKGGKAASNWLHVDLNGTTSGCGGIGARVRVVAGGTTQIREVSGGSGFCSQNSLTAEFGLGSAGLVDTLQITWPNGADQILLGVLPGQSLTVTEPPPSGMPGQPSTQRTGYELYSNYPNPFNPTTTILFDLPLSQQVRLSIFTVDGRRIATLLEDLVTDGRHQVTWNGRDRSGRLVASGTYFYRLEAEDFVETKRMTLLK